MGLKDDLNAEVTKVFKSNWTIREGRVVPGPADLKMDNDALELEGTVLYADLDGSTKMVDTMKPAVCAEVYKSFLHCAAKIIRAHGGEITAYDGDRVMAVFIGDSKNTSAMKCGLQINFSVQEIINPAFKKQYTDSSFVIRPVVGIDTSKLFIARTGVRGDNDLVWVGRAANYAAKLAQLDASYPTWITGTVFDASAAAAKESKGSPMWEPRTWTSMGGMQVYCSTWQWWSVD